MWTQYVCPVDPDVVLFEDEDQLYTKMILADRIVTCPKCGNSYFKSQCRARLPGSSGGISDEYDRE